MEHSMLTLHFETPETSLSESHPLIQELRKCLLSFDSEATAENLQCEFNNFTLQWEKSENVPTIRVQGQNTGRQD